MERRMLKRQSLIMIAILSVMGFFLIYRIIIQTDKLLSDDVLLHAKLITEMLDNEQVKALQGEESDLNTEAYNEIFKQLSAIKELDERYRYLYLMKLNDDGQPIFVMDIPPEEDNPLGSVYSEATDELKASFKNKTAFVEWGKDRWGDLVSPIVPIIDNDKQSDTYGQVIAIFGIDYDHREWKWTIVERVIFPLLMLILMCYVVILFVKITRHRNEILKEKEEKEKTYKALLENQRLAAIGQMAGAFSHDFNNYLQVILANIEVLNQKIDSFGDVRQYLKTIRVTTNDATTRVQMLQRFSGTKKSQSTYERINLNDVVSDAVQQSITIWKTEPEQQGIENHIIEQYNKTPDILGNDGELRAVLYNLIKNSVEAMEKGGTITIQTGSNPQGVYLRITDTGCGMSPEVAHSVFEPFFTTKGFESGRGLGLTGVYNIIHEHQGEIKLVSTKPDEGTTFEITLPHHNFPESAPAPTNSNPQDTSTDKANLVSTTDDNPDKANIASTTTKREKPNILWVDDDDLIRQIGYDMLSMLGYDITTAESGAEALEILASKEIDILFSDIGMPNMNGWQLMDKVAELYPNKMKRILISGWGDQITTAQKEEHNIDHIFGKPVQMAQLKKLLVDLWQ